MRPLHRTAALAALPLLVLAGCGRGGDDDGKDARGTTHPPSARTPSSAPGTAPATTPATAPATTHTPPRRRPANPPSPLPVAADGTDTAACGDGSCEVEVRAGTRLRTGSDPATLTFSAVAGGQVTVRASGSGSSFEASSGSGGVIKLNAVEITVRGVRGHRAVVRVTRT